MIPSGGSSKPVQSDFLDLISACGGVERGESVKVTIEFAEEEENFTSDTQQRHGSSLAQDLLVNMIRLPVPAGG